MDVTVNENFTCQVKDEQKGMKLFALPGRDEDLNIRNYSIKIKYKKVFLNRILHRWERILQF